MIGRVFLCESFQNIHILFGPIVTGEMLSLSGHGFKKMFAVIYYKTFGYE
jgi:hypothetical protein